MSTYIHDHEEGKEEAPVAGLTEEDENCEPPVAAQASESADSGTTTLTFHRELIADQPSNETTASNINTSASISTAGPLTITSSQELFSGVSFRHLREVLGLPPLEEKTTTLPIHRSINPDFWIPTNCDPRIQIECEWSAEGRHLGYCLVATQEIEPGARLIYTSCSIQPVRPENLPQTELNLEMMFEFIFGSPYFDFEKRWEDHPDELADFLTLLGSSAPEPPGSALGWTAALTRVYSWRVPKLPGMYFCPNPNQNFPPALIHHSCEPNADVIPIADEGDGLHAIRRIQPKEKITLNYLVSNFSVTLTSSTSWYAPKRIREKELKSNWNISSCTCSLCLNPVKSKEIDETVSSLPELDQQLEQDYSDFLSNWHERADLPALFSAYHESVDKLKDYPHHYLLFCLRSELIRRTLIGMRQPRISSDSSSSSTSSIELSVEDQWLEIVKTHLETLGAHTFITPTLNFIHSITIQRILLGTQRLDQRFDISIWRRGTPLRDQVFQLISKHPHFNDPVFRRLYCSKSKAPVMDAAELFESGRLHLPSYKITESSQASDSATTGMLRAIQSESNSCESSLSSTSIPNQTLRYAIRLTQEEMRDQGERVVHHVDELKEDDQ